VNLSRGHLHQQVREKRVQFVSSVINLLYLRMAGMLDCTVILYVSREFEGSELSLMLTVEVEREDDGRWIAEVVNLPGVQAYGPTRQEAVERAKALSLRVLADRLEHGETVPEMVDVFAVLP
jgi:predicted RNase H-like HicB family nuclease